MRSPKCRSFSRCGQGVDRECTANIICGSSESAIRGKIDGNECVGKTSILDGHRRTGGRSFGAGAAQIPDTLRIEFKDRSTFAKTVEQPRGSPAHPFDTDTLLAKLWENNGHREIQQRRQSLDEKLLRLAELNSIREVTALL